MTLKRRGSESIEEISAEKLRRESGLSDDLIRSSKPVEKLSYIDGIAVFPLFMCVHMQIVARSLIDRGVHALLHLLLYKIKDRHLSQCAKR